MRSITEKHDMRTLWWSKVAPFHHIFSILGLKWRDLDNAMDWNFMYCSSYSTKRFLFAF
jgi:hypothetical protein